MGSVMRTYLIEPQLLFVPYLSRVLADAGLKVIATSVDVDGKDIALHDPAAVFVDVDFFVRGAPNAICRIRQATKHAAVIAFSDIVDPMFEAACYISGASAVVSKREGVDVALRKVRGFLVTAATRPRSVSA